MQRHWEEMYEMALLETDQRELTGKIDAALVTLNQSLKDLGESPENDREREWIQDALRTLESIRRTDLTGTEIARKLSPGI